MNSIGIIEEDTITNTRKNLIKLSKEMDGVLKVTSKNIPVLAVLPWETFESLMETLEVMSDPELMKMINKSERDIEIGNILGWGKAKEIIAE